MLTNNFFPYLMGTLIDLHDSATRGYRTFISSKGVVVKSRFHTSYRASAPIGGLLCVLNTTTIGSGAGSGGISFTSDEIEEGETSYTHSSVLKNLSLVASVSEKIEDNKLTMEVQYTVKNNNTEDITITGVILRAPSYLLQDSSSSDIILDKTKLNEALTIKTNEAGYIKYSISFTFPSTVNYPSQSDISTLAYSVDE